jgi:glutathione reductase (NADPH)
MDQNFDVLVIGSGAAGSNIAMRCASYGLKTAIVDYRPYGGTCAIRGCDPKKILVDTAAIAGVGARLPELISKSPVIAWEDLIKFKNKFTDLVPVRRNKSYKEADITMLRGKARFVSPSEVIINNIKYSAEKIAVATGAKPRKLHIVGEQYLLNSEDFFVQKSLPDRIAFIGGGFISFEFAHVVKRFCSEVKIIHADNNPLDLYDQEIVEMLLGVSRAAGIEIVLDSPVTEIHKKNNQFEIITGNGSILSDLVFHGAGRVADTDELGLESANVAQDNGVIVNDYMQSITNESVYAAGDAAKGSPALTPVSAIESKIAAENIIEGNKKKRGFKIIPSTLFSIPPLGGVGLTEKDAIKQGFDFRKKFSETSNWYHMKKSGYKGTGFKVLIDKKSDLIIGAHILSPNAEDIINFISMAMQASIKTSEIKDMIFTYPSITSDIKYMI